MTPRPSEIRPVTSTQTAETRSICRRDECDSNEPPTPVRIMIGAAPPKASIVSSPWTTLAELLARVGKPYTSPQGRKPVKIPGVLEGFWGQTDLELSPQEILNRSDPKAP